MPDRGLARINEVWYLRLEVLVVSRKFLSFEVSV
jgi:hypothetical protein